MRLVELETTGLRGLRDASFRLEPDRAGPGNATVVTGPPHAGLTTFLDAVALTASRLAVDGLVTDATDVVRAGGTTARIRTTWWLDADERAYGGLVEETTEAEVVFQRGKLGRTDADPALLGIMSRHDHSPSLAKVVSIPALRVSDSTLPKMGDFEEDQRHSRLSSAPDKFAGITYALIKHASGFGERARVEAVQRLFGELCDTARFEGVSSSGQLDFVVASGVHLPLHRLSFGERNAFVLAAVPVLMGLQRSVILLDTPELGLAPGVAGRWLGALRSSMPGAQWIVASRDPAVIESVERSSRIVLGAGAP